MQKHVNLVDLVKSFPTNIYLQNLASIQKRTSPVKFAHLAEKSGKGSISNLSTKAGGLRPRGGAARAALHGRRSCWARADRFSKMHFSKMHFSKMHFSKILQIFGGLVLGCIKTKFCKKM